MNALFLRLLYRPTIAHQKQFLLGLQRRKPVKNCRWQRFVRFVSSHPDSLYTDLSARTNRLLDTQAFPIASLNEENWEEWLEIMGAWLSSEKLSGLAVDQVRCILERLLYEHASGSVASRNKTSILGEWLVATLRAWLSLSSRYPSSVLALERADLVLQRLMEWDERRWYDLPQTEAVQLVEAWLRLGSPVGLSHAAVLLLSDWYEHALNDNDRDAIIACFHKALELSIKFDKMDDSLLLMQRMEELAKQPGWHGIELNQAEQLITDKYLLQTTTTESSEHSAVNLSNFEKDKMRKRMIDLLQQATDQDQEKVIELMDRWASVNDRETDPDLVVAVVQYYIRIKDPSSATKWLSIGEPVMSSRDVIMLCEDAIRLWAESYAEQSRWRMQELYTRMKLLSKQHGLPYDAQLDDVVATFSSKTGHQFIRDASALTLPGEVDAELKHAGKRIFVANFVYHWQPKDLENHVRSIGLVPSHVFIFKGKGSGVVDFQTTDDAALAISKLNGLVLDGRRLFAREYRDSEKPSTSEPQQLRRIPRETVVDTERNAELVEAQRSINIADVSVKVNESSSALAQPGENDSYPVVRQLFDKVYEWFQAGHHDIAPGADFFHHMIRTAEWQSIKVDHVIDLLRTLIDIYELNGEDRFKPTYGMFKLTLFRLARYHGMEAGTKKAHASQILDKMLELNVPGADEYVFLSMIHILMDCNEETSVVEACSWIRKAQDVNIDPRHLHDLLLKLCRSVHPSKESWPAALSVLEHRRSTGQVNTSTYMNIMHVARSILTSTGHDDIKQVVLQDLDSLYDKCCADGCARNDTLGLFYDLALRSPQPETWRVFHKTLKTASDSHSNTDLMKRYTRFILVAKCILTSNADKHLKATVLKDVQRCYEHCLANGDQYYHRLADRLREVISTNSKDDITGQDSQVYQA